MIFVRRPLFSVIAPLLLCALLGGVAAVRAETPRPNIILILTDDQDLGSLEHMPRTATCWPARG